MGYNKRYDPVGELLFSMFSQLDCKLIYAKGMEDGAPKIHVVFKSLIGTFSLVIELTPVVDVAEYLNSNFGYQPNSDQDNSTESSLSDTVEDPSIGRLNRSD